VRHPALVWGGGILNINNIKESEKFKSEFWLAQQGELR